MASDLERCYPRAVSRTLAAALATLLVPAAAFAEDPPAASQDSPDAPKVQANKAAELAAGTFDHTVKLEEFQTRADQLQSQISDAMERVNLLRETVVVGSIVPTRAIIAHKNDLGSSFILEKVSYVLDGQPLLEKVSREGNLDEQKEFELLNGPLSPGEHEIQVTMNLAGSGFGLFTYLKGYKFKVESKYRFRVMEGRLTRLTTVAFARDDITLPPKDRPAVRYDIDVSVAQLDKKPAAEGAEQK